MRMYEREFPEVDDLGNYHITRISYTNQCTVMVRVKAISELGVYVSLLEYNNIEGHSSLRIFTEG